jgi:FHA domain-containing protein
MTLTLLAVSLNDQPLSQPITASFDARGGTIGRADHNTMALPDPQRHVSRKQAEIVAQGTTYFIRNVGAANPITVGSRTLGPGEAIAVADRDQIHIGGYLLKAQLDAEDHTAPVPVSPRPPTPASAAPQTVPRTVATQPPVSASNPFADLLGGATTAHADPFADLMPAPAGIHPRSTGLTPAATSAAAPRLPDDFDPFASPPAASAAPPSVPVDPFADLMPSTSTASIDQAFGLGASNAATSDDPLARFVSGLGPTSAGAAPAAGGALSTDPLALFGNPSPPAQGMAPAQQDNLSALHAAYQPPPLRAAPAMPPVPARAMPVPAPPPPVRPIATAPSAQPGSADAAALWAAFCQGAGVELPMPPGPPAECMRNIGQVLRSAIEGTLQLMAVRATTKHELRAAVTVIQQRENNPLKFSPDAKAGLEQLLRPPLRGFLDGPAAMDDAMSDLVGHAIGTVAGMRAAIDGMLDRFAPTELESKLVGSSMLDNVLPMNRRAKLWDLYLQHHGAIREEAQENFHALFGRAFLAAYEQQIERIKRNPRSR